MKKYIPQNKSKHEKRAVFFDFFDERTKIIDENKKMSIIHFFRLYLCLFFKEII